jgi:hypothetical protein
MHKEQQVVTALLKQRLLDLLAKTEGMLERGDGDLSGAWILLACLHQ